MIDDDRAYYRHRAEVELRRAEQARDHAASQVHRELAQAYLGKLVRENQDREAP